jgi:hypothetical protein
MRQSLARYSSPVSFVHAPSLVDFITAIVGFKVFGTHSREGRHYQDGRIAMLWALNHGDPDTAPSAAPQARQALQDRQITHAMKSKT